MEYHPIVLDRKIGESFKFKGKLEDYLSYEIEVLKNIENTPDTFECRLTMIVLEGAELKKYPYNGRFTITIVDNEAKSPGYKPIEKQIKK